MRRLIDDKAAQDFITAAACMCAILISFALIFQKMAGI